VICNIKFYTKNLGAQTRVTCSTSCANKRCHSEETKKKISESLLNYYGPNVIHKQCPRCNVIFISRMKIEKYCSKECSENFKRLLAKEKVGNWRHRTKQKIIEYLGGKCSKCGYTKCSNALDAHHLSDKDFSVSGKTISWERIKDELAKCVLLCSVCHRKEHMKKYDDIIDKSSYIRRINKKEELFKLYGEKCKLCGRDECLDFHHIEPGLKDTLVTSLPLEKAKEEAKKCIVVCSNCHREIHAGLHSEYLIDDVNNGI
jgi:cytochrome c553